MSDSRGVCERRSWTLHWRRCRWWGSLHCWRSPATSPHWLVAARFCRWHRGRWWHELQRKESSRPGTHLWDEMGGQGTEKGSRHWDEETLEVSSKLKRTGECLSPINENENDPSATYPSMQLRHTHTHTHTHTFSHYAPVMWWWQVKCITGKCLDIYSTVIF